jgi:hypothetical protein
MLWNSGKHRRRVRGGNRIDGASGRRGSNAEQSHGFSSYVVAMGVSWSGCVVFYE